MRWLCQPLRAGPGMLQSESVRESEIRSVVSNSLQPHGLYSPWNSLGQNTGVGSLSHLHGIFPSQALNPGFLHCRWILYQLSHKGRKPKNTGVGSLFHLQCIFLTQESNWGLLHCRRILYQLSYQACHRYFEMVESLLWLLFTVVIIIIIILYPLLCESHKWKKKNAKGY